MRQRQRRLRLRLRLRCHHKLSTSVRKRERDSVCEATRTHTLWRQRQPDARFRSTFLRCLRALNECAPHVTKRIYREGVAGGAGSRRRGSCFSYFALNFLCATMLKTPFFSPSGHRLLLRPFPYQSHGPHSLSKFSQFAHTHTHTCKSARC